MLFFVTTLFLCYGCEANNIVSNNDNITERPAPKDSWVITVDIYQTFHSESNDSSFTMHIMQVESPFTYREHWVEFDVMTLYQIPGFVTTGYSITYNVNWTMAENSSTEVYWKLYKNEISYLWLEEYHLPTQNGNYGSKQRLDLLPGVTYHLEYGVLEVN